MQTITLAYIAFVLGTIFELKKVAGQWGKVVDCLLSAFVLSLLIFLIGLGKSGYSLYGLVQLWPIAFSVALIIVFVLTHAKDIIVKLGEGVTLLHSMSILYFFIEYHYNPEVKLSSTWIIIFTVPTLYLLSHVLTYREITKRERLILSLWSTAVMTFFGLVYARNILVMQTIEISFAKDGPIEAVRVFFEYLFLGAAGAYIMQNVFMIFGYIPGRTELFSESYRQRIKDLNENHIERYSADQVARKDALLVLLIAGALFFANFFLKLVTPSFAIWICFISLPFALRLNEKK